MDKQDQNAGLLDQLGNFIARKGRRVWPLTVTGKAQKFVMRQRMLEEFDTQRAA